MTDTTPAITLPAIMCNSESYRRRQESGRMGDNPCIVCGKNCPSGRKARHVQLDTAADPIPFGSLPDGHPHDLGCFPVGPECAKLFPAEYVSELLLVN